jgi:hypothetical protein
MARTDQFIPLENELKDVQLSSSRKKELIQSHSTTLARNPEPMSTPMSKPMSKPTSKPEQKSSLQEQKEESLTSVIVDGNGYDIREHVLCGNDSDSVVIRSDSDVHENDYDFDYNSLWEVPDKLELQQQQEQQQQDFEIDVDDDDGFPPPEISEGILEVLHEPGMNQRHQGEEYGEEFDEEEFDWDREYSKEIRQTDYFDNECNGENEDEDDLEAVIAEFLATRGLN